MGKTTVSCIYRGPDADPVGVKVSCGKPKEFAKNLKRSAALIWRALNGGPPLLNGMAEEFPDWLHQGDAA